MQTIEYVIPVHHPEAQELFELLNSRDQISQTELHRKLSKYKVQKALSFIDELNQFATEWMKAEYNFICYGFAKDKINGRRKLHMHKNESLVIDKREKVVCLRIKQEI